jgi:hypothetical protein
MEITFFTIQTNNSSASSRVRLFFFAAVCGLVIYRINKARLIVFFSVVFFAAAFGLYVFNG